METLNFSWIIPGTLAGCAGPRQNEDLFFLRHKGITLLVRLAGEHEARVTSQQVVEAGLVDLHAPVSDFQAPSQDQIDTVTRQARRCINEGGKVAVSCRMGVGRTGTMLCCILVSMGFTVEEAFEKVRKERKQLEAFETPNQCKAIFTFAGRNSKT